MNNSLTTLGRSPCYPYLAAALILLAGLTGCSRPTEATSTWHEQTASGRPYGNILIVGLTEDSKNRRRFENTMTAAIKGRGVSASASHTQMDGDQPLNRETVSKIVAANGADAVLVTRLISHEVVGEAAGGGTGVATNPESERHYNLYRYDYGEYTQGASLSAKSTVKLSTEIYETKEGRLVYSIDTTTFDKASAFDILDEVTTAIAKRLADDRLIR